MIPEFAKKSLLQLLHKEFEKVFGDELDINDFIKIINYLMSYGWINQDAIPSFSGVSFAINKLQSVLGLKQTGLPDPVTIKTILTAHRCGCPDNVYLTEAGTAIRRWRLSNPNSPLTYKISGLVPGLSRSDQSSCWKEIWQRWSNVADLHFAETNSDTANILILAGSQQSGDGLGSPGNVLAYAYLPPTNSFDGQLRLVMDSAERWEIIIKQGIGILNVGVHEGGHILGLVHDNDPSAIMKPYYDRNIDTPQMRDASRMSGLYGVSRKPPPPAPPVPPQTPSEPIILKPGLYKVL